PPSSICFPYTTLFRSEGAFTPKFDEKGLITAIVTDARDNTLLMVAHMNDEALSLSLETGIAHYYSRSRGKPWKKGETSGNLQTMDRKSTRLNSSHVKI